MSLHRQLLRGSVAVVVLLSLLLWAVGRWVMHDSMEALIGSRLEHDAEALVAALDWPDGRLTFQEHVLVGPYLQPASGHYYVMHVDGTRFQSRSLWDEELPIHPQPVGRVRLDVEDGPQGRRTLMLHAAYRKQGREIQITVAEDIAPLAEAMRRLDYTFVAFTLLAAVALLLVQRWRIRKALAPLATVREQLDALGEGSRERIDAPVPDEIAPLIEAINRLVHVLQQRLQRSRNGLADMAHALKTPINVLVQDLAEVRPTPLQARLQAQIRRIREVIERELRRARIAGSGPGGEHWRPHEDLPDLVEVLERLHPGRRFILSLDESARELPLDREDLLELVGNLLDNACKWAERHVWLRAEVRDEALCLEIEDDGPGVPEAERERLLERGRRLDERVEGHGLGLAIVREIVESYEGELTLDRGGAGGLRVRVRLPLRVQPGRPSTRGRSSIGR